MVAQPCAFYNAYQTTAWIEGQEVTYDELTAAIGRDKIGFEKIRFCGERAAADGLQYFWVDTCCIDKANQIELSTAINSMFRWYQRASMCYVYLSDVSIKEEINDVQAFPIIWVEAFRRSRWFTRGWTLQELVAPASVEFFSKEGKRLGTKVSLEEDISKITKIPIKSLRGQGLKELSVDERMSWAAHRTTSLKEDKVYCLLGIFGVFLPLIYGEGEVYAMERLREEIEKRQEARPEIRMRACCTIPFLRDRDFIDRGTLLDELQEKCSAPASRTALVGLGGVGKSQLAIEHCYRTAEQSPETWVFWVHASNAARFEQSFRDIADSLKVEGRRDLQANIFKLVHDWLRDSEDPWLLILDNVDDARFLLHAPTSNQGQRPHDSDKLSPPLREYLPNCHRGSIVMTTRNREAALKLIEQRDIVAVEPMNKVQAMALLETKLGAQQTSSNLAELAAALEYMPLAIVQAAAYITERAPRCSVTKYLDDFRKSERKRLNLLSHDECQLRRDWEANNSILVTWQMSFEYIQQTRPSATDLLSLMSFFDRQGIPEALLQRRRDHNDGKRHSDLEDNASQFSAGDNEFEDDVLMLRNFCFISVDTTGTSFGMHALMQLATRKWLTANGKLEHWKQQFISNLCAAIPTGEFENWAICQTLFAHAKSAVEHEPKEESSKADWATLLHYAAWYAKEIGNITDAITLAEKSIKVLKKVLGQDHEDTLWSIGLLGVAYQVGGYWDDAEELGVQLLETRKKKLGVDHPDTLISMSDLALTYCYQGRFDDSERLGVQVIETRKKKLGADHPNTLNSINNLALTYLDQLRWNDAEELLVQVVETRKKKLRADHPDTITSMNNLALTYLDQLR
ncbi:hypothetical protein N0V83_010367 [Neocucurbitaria cava]|uniref:HET-domain-containing protein n=1 Tax=Neocucurbitaria cava TaxID=798079 RepID=A0A9W8Y0I8_9PLEO|nr:hypothetical protein N0V83_010367 [Neocucurbitaria cava]